jgi:hypothetical protein
MTCSSADAPTGRAVRLTVAALLLVGVATGPLTATTWTSPEPTTALLTDHETLTTTVRTAADFDRPAPRPTATATAAAPGPGTTAAPSPPAPPAPVPATTSGARPVGRGGDGR